MAKTKLPDKVTPALLKKQNEILLLRAIYAHDSISRVQLAALTSISRPSVTELTQNLIKRGLVNEIGVEQVADKVGKKPTLLALNPNAYHLIVVVVVDEQLIGALLDLRMRCLERRVVPIEKVTGNDLVVLIKNLVQSLLSKATSPLLGLVVGTPGIIDSQSGTIHLASNLGWIDIPLGSVLASHFNLPVYIGKDTHLAVVGEHRFGSGQNVDDLVVVQVGIGVGAGVLAEGRLIHGANFGAGEFGHSSFLGLEDDCICGKRGCLETKVSLWAVIRQAQAIAHDHPDSMLQQFAADDQITISDIRQAIDLGDSYSIALAKNTGHYLGQAITIIINLINPRRIILKGKLLQLGDVFLNEARRTAHERAFDYIASQTEIIATDLGDETMIFGAGALLLERELGLL